MVKPKARKVAKKVRKPIDGELRKNIEKKGIRTSKRVRHQVVLHQAPIQKIVKKSPKKRILEVNNKTSPSITKKIKKTGKPTRTIEEKKSKEKKQPKKGNDRLIPRENVPQYKENPFFVDTKTPDFVSSHVYHRWLIRAAKRASLSEMKTFFNAKKAQQASCNSSFSYASNFTATYEACKQDVKFATEFFKAAEKYDSIPYFKAAIEPNLLEYKSSGRSNFYMIGRATRPIEMSRGGREGNNALLIYATANENRNPLERLVQENTPYTKLVQLCKLHNTPFNEYMMESHLVTAARMGHRELALAFAKGVARNHMNDLHRQTLDGEKLPARILAISAMKKGFMNKSITPIHTAAIGTSVKMLEDLRVVCPNLNVPDADNWYTIHYAAVSPRSDCLKFILKNGGVVTMASKQQETPLHVAARAGRVANIHLIIKEMRDLENSADSAAELKPERSMVNARNRNGFSALHIAAIWNRLDVVDAMLVEPTVLVDLPTSTGKNKTTALMLACSAGLLPMAEKLISKGALIDAKDKKKRTALIHAMLNGQTHVAAMLLAKGANIKAADSSGNTAAHYASAYGFMDCLKLISSIEPSILSEENDWKLLPMSIAYLKGHYGIVTWLLDGPYKEMANINAKDSSGMTLLSSLLNYADAQFQNQMDGQIEYLTKRGAISSIVDQYGKTSLHYFSSIRVILKSAGDTSEENANLMNSKQYEKCLNMLLAAGGDVEAKDNENFSPLYYALFNGNLALFKLMLQKVENHRELLDKWTVDENFLHQILDLPMKVYKDKNLWKADTLQKSVYDVLPILELLFKIVPDLFQKWIHENNKNGYTPILAAVKQYSTLKSSQLVPKSRNEFIATMNTIFEWVIWLDDNQLIKQFHPNNENIVSIADIAMVINIELGKNEENEMALFKTLIKIAKETNKLREFFNISNELGDPLIITAINCHQSKVVELILDASRNAFLIDGVHTAIQKYKKNEQKKVEINKTVLMCLVENGMSELVSKINGSADFWARCDSNGNNIWHYAARVNHHRTVWLFKMIEEKHVERIANHDGRTALHEATLACDGSANSVMDPITWLATRATIDHVDKMGRTALHYAFGSESDFQSVMFLNEMDPIAVVSLLSNSMTREQLNIVDNDGNSAVHYAAMRNSTICLTTLIRKRADVDCKNQDGNTPLALAVRNGRQSAALTLIQANADVTGMIYTALKLENCKEVNSPWIWRGKSDAATNSIKTNGPFSIPSQVVSKGGSWESMVYVLIDILGRSIESMTQLVDAALRRSQLNLANQLLKSIEAMLDGKQSADSRYDLLRTFAEFCSSATLCNESIDRTVLDRIIEIRGLKLSQCALPSICTAIRVGNWSFVDFMRDKMGPDWKDLVANGKGEPTKAIVEFMAKNPVSSEADELLEQLVKLDLKGLNQLFDLEIPFVFQSSDLQISKLSPICWAILKENATLVRVLRKSGAKLDFSDSHGRTPLMYAFMTNNRSVVEAVIDDGKKNPEITKFTKPIQRENVTKIFFGSTVAKAKPSSADSEDEQEEEEEEEEEEEDEEEPPSKRSKLEKETEKKKKLVIANPSLFTHKDNSSRNPLYYLVAPFAWENVELLGELAASNKKVIIDGLLTTTQPSPIELAAENLQRRMTGEMLRILKGKNFPRPIKIQNLTMDTILIKTFGDVDDDARKYLDKFVKEADQKKKGANEPPKPSKVSTYEKSGELVYCEETNQYFDILLNKTDMQYGRYGYHNFYAMQIIKRRDCDLWILFTNWGRIGDGLGEYQTTPFSSLDLVQKEFKSVWKSKTGNEWCNLSEFNEQPKKYRLVTVDATPSNLSEVQLPKVGGDGKEDKDEIRRMIADISDPEILKKYSKQVTLYGSNISQPFGRFTKENIDRARKVLDKLEVNAKKLEKLLKQSSISESELLDVYLASNDLSGQYYSLIPTKEFEYANLPRLDKLHDIARHRMNLNRYEEIETATRIVCAAAWRSDLDRVSYIRSALECEFRLEAPESSISQSILQWIYRSRADIKIRTIIEISPKHCTENFVPFLADDNQKLLFHGTNSANMMSILKNGFLIDPPAACRNGNLFGPGIYLADSFEKSSHYCKTSAFGANYMLICQTALGNVKKITTIPYHTDKSCTSTEKGIDTIHYIGQKIPSGSLTQNGIAIPLMPLREFQPDPCNGGFFNCLDWSEYIVRNPNRILPKYVVVF